MTRRCALWLLAAALANVLPKALPALRAQDTAALVAQLGSTELAARSRAFELLQQQGDAAAIPLLAKALPKFPLDSQRLGLIVLERQPIEATRAAYGKLATADAPLPCAAALATLARHGERDRLPALAKVVAAAAVDARSYVLAHLWGLEDPALANAVRLYLVADAPPGLVQATLEHLQAVEHGHSAPTAAAIQPLRNAADPRVRTAVLAWLASADPAAATELAQLLRQQADRVWSITSLLRGGGPLPRPALEAIAGAGASAATRYQVKELTDLLRGPAPDLAIAMLQKVQTATAPELRTAALGELATLPGGLDDQGLRALLQSGDADQQLVAAATLRRRDDPSGLPTVVALAERDGPHLAETARVLGGFRAAAAVPALLHLLDSTDEATRSAAWQSLQTVWRDLFPYRRFDFAKAGYSPNSGNRAAGIAVLARWWDAVSAMRGK